MRGEEGQADDPQRPRSARLIWAARLPVLFAASRVAPGGAEPHRYAAVSEEGLTLAGMASAGFVIACTDSRVLAVLGFPLASWWGCPLQAVGRPDLAGATLGLWPHSAFVT